jgi:hypothetical protein
MPLNPDPDRNGYTEDEVDGFKAQARRKRKRIARNIENNSQEVNENE